MVMGMPVTVTMPSWLSKEQGIAAAGCAGGFVFSDYLSASVITRMGWTGTTAFVGCVGAKTALGAVTFLAAGKTSGGLATALGLASVGAFASIAIDVVRYVWPAAAQTPGARLRAAYLARGRRVAAPAIGARVATRVAAPIAAVRLRAETPSGEALGGF
ncbi:hypothetical protein ES703_00018 [subsurface metagenome]